MLKQRLCEDPKSRSSGKAKCPDIWELEDGSFLVIGTDRTEELRKFANKDGVYLDDDERIVVIPRHTLVSARNNIPTA